MNDVDVMDNLPKGDPKDKGDYLPEPVGYTLLVAPVEAERETEGGVIKPDGLVAREDLATVVGFVLKVGPEAYKDKGKFPGGKPWCKKGDFVMFRTFAGTRFKIFDKSFRLIPDDAVEAVVQDPRGIQRV